MQHPCQTALLNISCRQLGGCVSVEVYIGIVFIMPNIGCMRPEGIITDTLEPMAFAWNLSINQIILLCKALEIYPFSVAHISIQVFYPNIWMSHKIKGVEKMNKCWCFSTSASLIVLTLDPLFFLLILILNMLQISFQSKTQSSGWYKNIYQYK